MAKCPGFLDVGALRGVSPMAGARRASLTQGLLGALLPVQCAGCLVWDEVLCPSCRALASSPPVFTSVEGRYVPIPGVVLGDYSGPLRRIVLAAKHATRTDVSAFLDEAGATLGASLWEAVGGVGTPAGAVAALPGRARSGGGAVRCACGSCQRPRRGVGACGGDRWPCRSRAGLRGDWRRWLRPVCGCVSWTR